MNKDETIKDMAKIANFSAFDYKQGKVQSKSIYTAMAEALYNANCRIIADDEIVIAKRQYKQLKKYNRDRKRLRLKWKQAKQDLDDIYSNGFVLLAEHHEIVDQVARETRQETSREILQEAYMYFNADNVLGLPNYLKNERAARVVKGIAKSRGIELEDENND